MECYSIKIYEKYSSFIEVIKWSACIILLIIAGISGCFYHDYHFLYRVIISIICVVVAVCCLLTTRHGKLMLLFFNQAYEEVCKVIWPTFHESFYTTMIIMSVTFVISVILWGLDSVLMYIVSLLLRL